MMRNKSSALQIIVLATIACASSTSEAAIVVNAVPVGNDIVFSGGGTPDISAVVNPLEPVSVLPTSNPAIYPFAAVVLGGDANSTTNPGLEAVFRTPQFTGPTAIGPGLNVTAASSSSGDFFGLGFRSQFFLLLPENYVEGTPVSGSATYENTSFSSLGIEPGSYEWSWETAIGRDTFTLNVVPEPGSATLCVIGTLLLVRRYRKRSSFN